MSRIAGSKVIAAPVLAGGLAFGDNGTHETGRVAPGADARRGFSSRRYSRKSDVSRASGRMPLNCQDVVAVDEQSCVQAL